MAENGASLVKVLEIAERNRTIAYAEKHNVKVLNDIIAKQFDITVKIPKGYELRSQSDNFIWASYEFPVASQGFFCYSYPYQGKGSLTADYLIAMRNNFAKRIPGPSDGSYMITVEQIPAITDDKVMGHGIDAVVNAATVLYLLTFERHEDSCAFCGRVRTASILRRP